jgi:hypothetical protein
MPNEIALPRPFGNTSVQEAILNLVAHVPPSRESRSAYPAARAKAISRHAARQASMTAGSLALPPGVLGWLTLLPELLAVWRLQAQMVSDIAGVYGKERALGREQMLYCLFKQVSAQLFRDIAVRAGERLVFQVATSKAINAIAQKLGVHITQTLLKKGVSRFVPLLGAVGVGAYAYVDTLQVAKNAIALFESDIVMEDETVAPTRPA